jgi:hypothetical protein
MTRLLLTFALLLAVSAASTPSGSAEQDVDCDDVAVYLETLDASIAGELQALVNDPEWVEGYGQALETMEELGDEPVSRANIQPFLDYIGFVVPVLESVDEAGIPEIMKPLHVTSIVYWTVVPNMFAGLAEQDKDATYAHLANIESLTEQNMLSQVMVRVECAETIAPHMERSRDIARLLGEAERDNIEAVQNASEEDLHGIGLFFLFFADYPEDANVVIVTSNSTPVVVNGEPDSTPES